MLAVESKAAGINVTDSSKIDSNRSWEQLVEPVKPFLHAVKQRLFEQVNNFDPQIIPYAQYTLNGSGKYLRPTLLALAANSIGKTTDAHVNAAVIVEMVHLATLAHDDVLDETEIRRRQPTLAANWGNEIAVLLGDCLFAQASKLAASFPTPQVCRAVAMAANTVCTGELLQTQHRCKFQASRREYFRVIEMKTGELFMLSCDLAALLSEATAEHRAALQQFGKAFGSAYQIYDDCVDLFGSEEIAGKSLGTDLAKGKLIGRFCWHGSAPMPPTRHSWKIWSKSGNRRTFLRSTNCSPNTKHSSRHGRSSVVIWIKPAGHYASCRSRMDTPVC